MQEDRKVKQVIVVRKDLKMPQGKLCAQVAHASLAAISNRGYIHEGTKALHVQLDDPAMKWFSEDFTKVVVYVKSEEELRQVYEKAKRNGVSCSLIKDAGRTVFTEETYTTCAVGPGWAESVDEITGKLPLV